MNDEYYMDLALEEARKSLEENLFPVGAILVVNGEVVARARRQKMEINHAETVLLREYFSSDIPRRSENDIVLYTTLEPCMMCLGVILHLPVNRIVYAAKDPYGGGIPILTSKELPLRHKKYDMPTVGGVRESEAKELFRKYVETSDVSFYKDTTNPLVAYFLET